MARFLRLFTELPLEEAQRLGKLQGSEINEAKQILATKATQLAHGHEAAHAAAETRSRRAPEASGERDPGG